MPIKLIKHFLQLESFSSILLFIMLFISFIFANWPILNFKEGYLLPLQFFINDGLMAFFFLLVGLELKRGYLEGQITKSAQVLPITGAFFGMLVPGLIYYSINYSNPVTAQGWAIPVATDIAFALGVLSLFGKKVPVALKLFLLSLAIFDDLGAIIIIAFFHTHHLGYLSLIIAGLIVVGLLAINQRKTLPLFVYLLIGFCLWYALYKAGIHPTIAGVLLALTIPAHSLNSLEKNLHPWVAYGIMPIFALTNAGFSFASITINDFSNMIVIGIVLGLFIGKQLGIMVFSWLLIKLKWVKMPSDTTWLMFYGVAIICGIGFTMSLFLGNLCFHNHSIYTNQVRLGVIIGSTLSGLLGVLVLKLAFAKQIKHR